MERAEHMMNSMTMPRLSEYQREYTSLVDLATPSAEDLDRIGLLEIIFTKLDQGKILIEETVNG